MDTGRDVLFLSISSHGSEEPSIAVSNSGFPLASLTAARVLRRSASNWWTTVILDKGSMDGIGTDSPVITDVGLVGKTGKVALHTAEVMLLTDEECRVAARVEGHTNKEVAERFNISLRLVEKELSIALQYCLEKMSDMNAVEVERAGRRKF